MAAIDIIENMTNSELVDYYKYCMVKRFEELKHYDGIYYHPSYDQCSVSIGKNKIYRLHYENEMFLLNQMWTRMVESSILKQCWWLAQNIFQTPIDLPFKKDVKNYLAIKIADAIKEKNRTIEYNGEVFNFIASGTKRETFLSPCKNYVIKIPIEQFTLLGLLENEREAQIYNETPNSIYAKCELIENGWLKMEFVQPKYFSKDDEYPDWTLTIAEHQVGYTRDGRLVAYDYGSTI